MNKKIPDNQLDEIAKIVKNKIFVPSSQKKVTVFLCGADIDDNKTGRSKMATLLSKNNRYRLLYPENLFDDLLAGQGQHSLLELENILADSVDAIVIFPESPGSFAELGAFSNNEKLAQKLICLSNKKYQKDKSFINFGPYRLIRSSKTGKVIHLNYDDLAVESLNSKIFRNVNDYIGIIKRTHPVEKNVANILETEHFILPCIYLVECIDNVELYYLIEKATGKERKLCEIATKSAIGLLIKKRYIKRTSVGYTVTSIGAEYVRDRFNGNYLDRARIELINVENRRNSKVSYDRVVGMHL